MISFLIILFGKQKPILEPKFDLDYAIWQTKMEKLFVVSNNLDKFKGVPDDVFREYIERICK